MFGALVRQGPEPPAQLRIRHHPANGLGERLGVSGIDEQGAFGRDLAVRRNVAGNGGQAPGEALGHREAVPLVGGGVDGAGGTDVEALELVIVLPSQERKAIGNAGAPGPRPELLLRPAPLFIPADELDLGDRSAAIPIHDRECIDDRLEPFVSADGAHHEQPGVHSVEVWPRAGRPGVNADQAHRLRRCEHPHDLPSGELRDGQDAVRAARTPLGDGSVVEPLPGAPGGLRVGQAAYVVDHEDERCPPPEWGLVSDADERCPRPVAERRDQLLVEDPAETRPAARQGRLEDRARREMGAQAFPDVRRASDHHRAAHLNAREVPSELEHLTPHAGELRRQWQGIDHDEIRLHRSLSLRIFSSRVGPTDSATLAS